MRWVRHASGRLAFRVSVLLLCVSTIFVSLNHLSGNEFGVGGQSFTWINVNRFANSWGQHRNDTNGTDAQISNEKQPQIPLEAEQGPDEAESSPDKKKPPQRPSEKLINSYIDSIFDPSSTAHYRMSCPPPTGPRYQYLQKRKQTYFFALNLHQNFDLLPRLLGTVVEAIKFLGPKNCVLSIVEGFSGDGTAEVVASPKLRKLFKKLGVQYLPATSDVRADHESPLRIHYLAELRNAALEPLYNSKTPYDPSTTTIVFLNDVYICMEDILELIHQQVGQGADLVCGIDWQYPWPPPMFYDCWIARDMKGDTFFDIDSQGGWHDAHILFPFNPATKEKYERNETIQVFSCWNGGVVMPAEPFLEPKRGKKKPLRFRDARQGECGGGEPTMLCKDMWYMGYGKIAVVPTVNVGYWNESSIKDVVGFVSNVTDAGAIEGIGVKVDWQSEPPEKVRCGASLAGQRWKPWNNGLDGSDFDLKNETDTGRKLID